MTNSSRKIIAVDAMGGDSAPESVFMGLARLKTTVEHFVIFGDQEVLDRYIKVLPSGLSYEIRHTSDVVTGDMEVMTALRAGKKSSMGLAIQAVKNGEAQAVVSSGNTGMYMALSKIILGTVPGIDRPAIASMLPGKNGRSVCVDLGANAECNAKNLIDFAILGDAVARTILNKTSLKIALLNIGSENAKGSRLVKHAAESLKTIFRDEYVGFVEGNDLLQGNVDVIVTDGFTGNVALKTIEGTAKFIVGELKNVLSKSWLAKLGILFCLPALNELKRKFDPRLYNGAIIAGLNGIVVKSHGNSDAVGFANAVQFTSNLLDSDMFERMNARIYESNLHIELSNKENNA